MRQFLTFYGYLFATYVALRLVVLVGGKIVPRLRRLRRRRRRRRRPEWRTALLARIEGDARRIHPSVQVQGDPIPPRAVIRYRVIDENRRTQFSAIQRLPVDVRGTELSLKPIAAGPDVDLDDVMRGRWEISIYADGRRVARWNHRLEAFGGVNAEGEIKLL